MTRKMKNVRSKFERQSSKDRGSIRKLYVQEAYAKFSKVLIKVTGM
jgi:hypothetical protein